MRYTKWKCGYCQDEFITDKKVRWDMVECQCGKTAVDDELFYRREMGDPIIIGESDDINELNQNKDEYNIRNNN